VSDSLQTPHGVYRAPSSRDIYPRGVTVDLPFTYLAIHDFMPGRILQAIAEIDIECLQPNPAEG